MKILFVCSGNAYRSPVAEALLKKLKPEIEVDSAGTDAASLISDVARRYLASENAQNHLKKVPEGLEKKDLSTYDLIIVMKQEHKDIIASRCSECENRLVVWNIDDPYFLPHGHAERIFGQIKEKVTELANSL
jgi:protein-tyrosine-phosphatase